MARKAAQNVKNWKVTNGTSDRFSGRYWGIFWGQKTLLNCHPADRRGQRDVLDRPLRGAEPGADGADDVGERVAVVVVGLAHAVRGLVLGLVGGDVVGLQLALFTISQF